MNSKKFTCSYFIQLTGGILLALFLCNTINALPTNTSSLQQNKPQTTTATEQQNGLSDLLSVDIKDVALADMLKFIGDNFGIEFVDSQKLPKIFLTVKVNDAPWQEILAAVLQAHNISYQLVDKKCYLYFDKDTKANKNNPLTLTKGQTKGFGDPDFKGAPISIDIKDVNLDEVLRFLSENYGFNFALNQALKNTKVTVKTDDVPWDQALSALLKEHHLSYSRIGTVIYIFPA